MNRIEIDFSGHLSWGQRLGWIVLACGFVAVAVTGWRYISLSNELEQARKTRQQLLDQLAEQSAAAQRQNSAAQEQATEGGVPQIPWEGLFQSLEQAAGDDVALLELEPNAESKDVRLAGEARNLEAMLVYLRRLQQTTAIGEIRDLSHQEQVDDPQRPVRFELNAQWRWAAH